MFGLISLEENRKLDGTGQPLTEKAILATAEQTSPQVEEEKLTSAKNNPRSLGSFVSDKTQAFSKIAQTLGSDFQIIFERDPAARNGLEVLCCYPGLHALVLHRIAHWLHQQKVPFFPRFLSHLARFLTGIEIHPGATIGRGVFIDHGMGVVIGETAIVGDYCLIYQNVTLGGTGKETGKRHPTLGNHVIVGTGAKVLGNIQIGNHVRIGAGSIVLGNVPNDCTVVGVPGRIISRSGRGCPLEHGKLPDVEASVIRSLLARIEQLEQKLQNVDSEEKQKRQNSSDLDRIVAYEDPLEQTFLLCELPQVTNLKVEFKTDPQLNQVNPLSHQHISECHSLLS